MYVVKPNQFSNKFFRSVNISTLGNVNFNNLMIDQEMAKVSVA